MEQNSYRVGAGWWEEDINHIRPLFQILPTFMESLIKNINLNTLHNSAEHEQPLYNVFISTPPQFKSS